MRPLVVAYGSRLNDSINFVTLQKEVLISELIEEIESILKWCNGHRIIDEIRDLSQINDEVFKTIVTTLIENEILIDARSLGQIFHQNSMYPLLSTHDLSFEEIANLSPKQKTTSRACQYSLASPKESELLRLLSVRKSSRTFGKESLTGEQLSGLLQAMYGTTDLGGSTPSAGGLYILRIYVLLLKQAGTLREGVYEYIRETHGLRKVKTNMLTPELTNFLLDSEGLAVNASAIVCVGIDFDIAERKYANRAYRFLLLESGHVAQNAYLYSAEAGLNIVECGGFNDLELSRYLHLNFPQQGIVTTLVVGTNTSDMEVLTEEYSRAEWALRHELMDGDQPKVKTLSFDTHLTSQLYIRLIYSHTEYVSS